MKKKIKIIRVYEQTDNDTSSKFLAEIKEFDTNGNLINDEQYNNNDKVVYQNTVEILDGKITKEHTLYNDDDASDETKIYRYNDDGKIAEIQTINSGGWSDTKIFERDTAAKTLTVSTLDDNNDIEEKSITTYDDNGNIVSTVVYDYDNNQTQKNVNTYDEHGRLLLKEEYNAAKKPEKYYHYFYDGDRLVGVQTLNHGRKIIDWVRLTYDEQQRPVEQKTMSGSMIQLAYDDELAATTETIINPDGSMQSKTTTIKNADGNIVEEHSGNKIITYEYEYFD